MTDISERFSSYEEDLALIFVEISGAIENASSQVGEARKASLSSASRSADEAKELIGSMELEIQNIPTAKRSKPNQKIREYKLKLDSQRRELRQVKEQSSRRELLGARGDGQSEDGESYEQRNRLLNGTDRLERSSQRLQSSQRLANETEGVGAGILRDLHVQREQITNARDTLMRADGYVDKSMKSLKSMGRR